MKLTEEQQQRVTENHNLIYQYIHTNRLDVEEWYGVFAIELCKAVVVHDPKKGTLSTLFYTMCRNQRYREYTKSKAQKRDGGYIYSLDWEYKNDDTGVDTLGAILEDESVDVEDDMMVTELLEELCSGEHGEIIRLKHLGYSQGEIAEMVGFSQAHVSRVIIRLREEYFGDT